MKNKKILFICPYPYDVQAGQRFKFERHYQNLIDHGYDIEINSFFSKKMWNILYKKGYFITKLIETLISYYRRYFLLSKLSKYETVYLFLWGTPFFDSFFEKNLVKRSNKLIYDLEDNVFVRSKNQINPIVYYLKSSSKIFYLIKKSDYIICSSLNLKNICNSISNKNNSYYIPPSINIHRYNRCINYDTKSTIVIGWTGTFSSIKYLKVIENSLIKISEKYKIIFKVIGNFEYNNKYIPVENIIWNKKNEIDDLLSIDIGVYPLIDEEWISGKSGLKALQYMALGIPTISTKIGNITNIVEDNKDGLLVENNEIDWYSAIEKLIINNNLRKKIGNNARLKIINNYTSDNIKFKYLEIISKK